MVLACRDARKAEAAAAQLRAAHPRASLEVLPLDLASLAVVRDFAKRFADRHARLDVLVNNAGVMAIPRRTTADGFEMQLGTNHLGPLRADRPAAASACARRRAPRVVTVSSTAHRGGRMRWDDLHGEQQLPALAPLRPEQAREPALLLRAGAPRSTPLASALVSAACHPGYSATNLQFVGARMDGSRVMESADDVGQPRLLAGGARWARCPRSYAATAPGVRGGDYYGPERMFESWGHPKKVGSSRALARPRVGAPAVGAFGGADGRALRGAADA